MRPYSRRHEFFFSASALRTLAREWHYPAPPVLCCRHVDFRVQRGQTTDQTENHRNCVSGATAQRGAGESPRSHNRKSAGCPADFSAKSTHSEKDKQRTGDHCDRATTTCKKRSAPRSLTRSTIHYTRESRRCGANNRWITRKDYRGTPTRPQPSVPRSRDKPRWSTRANTIKKYCVFGRTLRFEAIF